MKNMKSRDLLFLLLTLVLSSVFSQEKTLKDSIADSFLKENSYFHGVLKEKFFIHTNKNLYFSGEKIWFKAYIVKDIDDKPYNLTKNLSVSLLNSDKKTVLSSLFFVEKGSSFGEIELPKTLLSGKYFIELTTSWDSNFSGKKYTHAVDVVNLDKNKKTIKNTLSLEESKIKIDFYPESGILLKKRFNRVYIKVKKGGKVLKLKGKIIDEETGKL